MLHQQLHKLLFLAAERGGQDSGSKRLKNVSKDTQDILDEFNRTYKKPSDETDDKAKLPDKFSAVRTKGVLHSLTFINQTLLQGELFIIG